MDKLTELYKKINSLSDEIPAELSKKITLYSQALQWIGKHHSEAVLAYGSAYAERKRVYGETVEKSEGTQAVKEGKAEQMAYWPRTVEAEKEAEMWKWKNLYSSTEHIINALKIELKVLMKEYGGD